MTGLNVITYYNINISLPNVYYMYNCIKYILENIWNEKSQNLFYFADNIFEYYIFILIIIDND